jgi:hypothetical protein
MGVSLAVAVAGALLAQSGADLAPHVTLGSGAEHVAAPYGGGCTSSFVTHTALCADPPAIVPGAPELHVAPGGAIDVSSDAPLTGAAADLVEGMPVTIVQTGPLSYRIALPASLPAESHLWFSGHWANAQGAGDAEYPARLTLPATAAVPGGVRWLTRRRLRWTVACPRSAATACSGTVSLRSRRTGALVARASFGALAAGASAALTATVRPSALRDLRAHRSTALRAVVAPPGGTPARTSLRLSR